MKSNSANISLIHRSAKLLRSLQITAVAPLLLLVLSWPAAAQTWIQQSPTGTPPTARADSGRAYDAIHDRLILFGGWGQTGRPTDVWVLSNATGAGGTPNWEQLSPTGGPPHDREGQTVVYDPTSNRIIVYGGCFATCGNAMQDVWVLTNANGLGGTPQWIQLPDAPVGRAFHSGVYDPVSNRMIIFGGNLAFFNTDQNDVWVLVDANGIGSPHWEQLSPTGTAPAPREMNAAFYDHVSNRMIILGGGQFNGWYCCSIMFDDVWALTQANGLGGVPQWIQLTPTGTLPHARFWHSAHYDPSTRRMTIFGGAFDQRPGDTLWFDDVWALTEANGVNGTPQWIQLAPTGGPVLPRMNYSGGYSTTANRMVVAMGRGNNVIFNDVWVLTDANGEPPAQCIQPPSGLVAWWPAEGNADDIVGSNNGTLVGGVAFTAGKVGQAFKFDGIDDIVLAPATGFPTGNAPRTVAFWSKLSPSNDYAAAFGYSTEAIGKGFYVFPSSPYFRTLTFSGHGQDYDVFAPNDLRDDLYHHVAVTYDGTTITIYADGIAVASGDMYLDTGISGGASIGGRAPLLTFMTGEVDEVALWNRSLSASEIQTIFSADSAGMCTNRPPLAYAGADQIVEATSPAGASVTLNGSGSDPDSDPLTFLWKDGANNVVGNSASVPLTLPLGTHSFTLSVDDGKGGTASDEVVIKVQDTTPPAISITTPANAAAYLLNATVAASYSCTDSGSGMASCTGPVASGVNMDTASVGTKNFLVNAQDAAGNKASLTYTYKVQYGFPGFQSPVDNLPVINTAKAGSTIPVKWRLFDNAGAPVASLTTFTSLTSGPIACSADPSDAIEEVVSTGGTVLRYDAATGQFTYNWQTAKSWVGCRLLQLTLADGMKYYAKFQLK